MNNETQLNEEITGKRRRLPSYEEVDEMAAKAFPVAGAICQTLCNEYQAAVDALQDAPPKLRAGLIARLKAIATQMRQSHCPTCVLE